MQVSQINIYPVKSLDGYTTQTAIVEKRGLRYDRRWMIADTEGVFLTQRTESKMALLKAIVENDTTLVISEKQNPQNRLEIPIEMRAEAFKVQVWDDNFEAHRVSAAADAFLSDFFGKKCHLIAMSAAPNRPIDPDYALSEQNEVSFADGFPLLLIGEESAQHLQKQLPTTDPLHTATPLEILRRFRANIIFSGGTPHIEDSFKHFRIGEVPFVGVKPCARCVLTTRDPDTGIKGKEPLATLQTYRQNGRKTLFGQNVIWNDATWQWAFEAEINVGDTIFTDNIFE